jgi:hypothetical protein
MTGCLTLPFRLLGVGLLLIGGYVAWSYRREIRRQVHQWTADSTPASASGVGVPGRARAIRRTVESLGASGADSLVLSAGDLASLAAGLAADAVPGALDSVEVRLDADDLEIHAIVDTRKAPVSFGALSGMVRDREIVEAGGRLLFRRGGLAEWQIERVRIRGLPLPMDLVDRLLRRFAGRAEGGVLGLPLPTGVTGLRVLPSGVTLYGVGSLR